MAPEIVLKIGHSFEADLWSLGVLIYELLNGASPFYDESPIKIQRKILQNKPKKLESFSHYSWDLIE